MMCQETGRQGAEVVDREGRERLAMTGTREQKADGERVRDGGTQPGGEVVRGLDLVTEGEEGPSWGGTVRMGNVEQRSPSKEGAG